MAVTVKPMFFERPTQDSRSKFSVAIQKDKDLWEDTLNAGKIP
jgi:hypothetical protein